MAIIDSSDTIDAYYPGHRYQDFRFWFREDINYDIFFSLSALYLYPWGSAIDRPASGKTPPSVLAFDKTDEFHYGDNIVIVSSNPRASEVIAEANQALAAKHVIITLKEEKEIGRGSVHFTLYFTRINPMPIN
jgi:hypothetical protein